MAEFRCGYYRSILQLSPGSVAILSGVVVKTPGKRAVFDQGVCATNDQEIIDLIRKSQPYLEGKIREVTEGDRALLPPAGEDRLKNTRGVASALDVGRAEAPGKPQLAEKAISVGGSVCSECGMTFKTPQGLKVHLVQHRKSIQPQVAEGE